MEKGLQAMQEAKYAEAENAFENILKKDSDNAEVRYLLAKAQFKQGKMKEADRSIVRALRSDPQNVEFMVLQLEIGFPRELLKLLRRTRKDDLSAKILAIDPSSVLPNIQLGKGYMYEWLEWRNRLSIDGIGKASAGWIGSPRPTFSTANALGTDHGNRPQTRASARAGADPFALFAYDAMGNDIQQLNARAESAYPKALRHLRRALLTDPTNQEAYLHLARLYFTRPDIVALRKLSINMQKHRPDDYYSWLLGGYAQHYDENAAKAEAQFQKAFSMMPDSVESVYEDVDRLLNKKGLAEKENAGAFDEKGFWDFRDPRRLTEQNERLADHYARVTYADLLYSEKDLNLKGWDSDRGEVYIRYGQPNIEFYLDGEVANCGANTYRLFHVLQYPQGRFVFGNLSPHLNEFIYYSPCAQVVSGRDGIGANSDYKIIAKNNIHDNPEVYNYDAAGTRIPFPSLISKFKGRNGNTDVYIPYGIPIEFNALEINQSLAIQSGAFLVAEDGNLLDEHRRIDHKIYMKESTRFAEATLWMDAHHLEVAPGNYGLSIEFETDSGAGVGFTRSALNISSYGGSTLELSDLLLAYSGEDLEEGDEQPTGTILRDGLLIKPAPWGVFSASLPMYLYFEMYNLKKKPDESTSYSVETVLIENRDEKGLAKVLKRAFRGKAKEGVSASFQNEGTSADDSQFLILDTEDLKAGTYVLVVRVHDLVAKKTVESRRIVLLE